MVAADNKAVIRRWIEEAWNSGNLEIADELYSRDFRAKSMEQGLPDLQGPGDIKASVRRFRSAFPDVHFEIDHLLAEGDKVVGAFTIEGTHLGELQGIPPTGKRVTLTAIDIWRFEDGKITERCTAVADVLSMLQQLGVLPAGK